MRLSKNFTAAIKILLFIEEYRNESLNGPRLSELTKIDEVSIRQIMKALKDNDIITSKQGPKGGIKLIKELQDISLYDIYSIFETDHIVLTIGKQMMSPDTSIKDRLINEALSDVLARSFNVYMEEMKKTTMQDFYVEYIKQKRIML